MRHKSLNTLKKRLTAAAAAGMLGILAAVSGVAPTDAWADWGRVNGTYQMPDGSSIDGVIARGIDVSHWKGEIDWNAVAGDDIQFVMLGTTYAGGVDPQFRANAVNASNAGLKVGAYLYSYAVNPEMASAEADFILNLVKDYPISFPIAFDVEAKVQSTLTPGELSAIINTFCDKIAAAGYYPLVYANDNWLANKIDMSQVRYDVWVARYGTRHAYSNPVMWQATSTGAVNGISGNVDIDFLFRDLSDKLPANQWRTIGGQTYFYQDYVMQKDNWIHDGQGWYYMNSDGLAATGWIEQNGAHYYLEETGGKMATGWKQFDNGWYYFAENGAMASGWVTVDGLRYYLNPDGVMATGWQDDQGMRYYLKGDGSMTTGWSQIDQSWYYFNAAGDMARGGWIQPDGSWYYMDPDGRMKTGWYSEGGTHYYLSADSGKMTVGWRELDGSWYYFGPSGAMMTGFVEINGLHYYLNPSDGKMAVNTTIDLDGTAYTVDASGVCSQVIPETTDPNAPPAPDPSNSTQSPTQVGPGV